MVKKLQLKSLNDLKNNNQIVKFILDDIKKDLIDLKVFHDCFRSEKLPLILRSTNLYKNCLRTTLLFMDFKKSQKV